MQPEVSSGVFISIFLPYDPCYFLHVTCELRVCLIFLPTAQTAPRLLSGKKKASNLIF